MPSKIVRNVLQCGSSKVVALPPDWMRMMKIGVGNNVDVYYNSIVIIKPSSGKFDPELLRKELELILKLESEAPS